MTDKIHENGDDIQITSSVSKSQHYAQAVGSNLKNKRWMQKMLKSHLWPIMIICTYAMRYKTDDSVQVGGNSIANTLELPVLC